MLISVALRWGVLRLTGVIYQGPHGTFRANLTNVDFTGATFADRNPARASDATWHNTTCPDGKNSDHNPDGVCSLP